MMSALLFPGQGSQEPGMGRDAAENDKSIMDLWKKAEKYSGLDLRAIYWEGAEKDMAETSCLQPALTVVNLGLWSQLSKKLVPAAVAGHSLGEYSALAAAGVLSEDAVLQLVSLRGRLMSQADPEDKGAMAAVVKLSMDRTLELLDEVQLESGEMIQMANYNSPAQFVVSGTRSAIDLMRDKVRAAKGRAIALAVSGAFHSPMMADAAKEMTAAIRALPATAWNRARFPMYCNADPRALSDIEAIKDLLVMQMTSPVFWIDTITRQWDAGCRLFVECGPKGVLCKMVGQILGDHAPAIALHSDEAPVWSAVNVSNRQQVMEFSQ